MFMHGSCDTIPSGVRPMDSIFQWIFGVRRSKIHGELDAWVSVFSTTVERQALNAYVLLIRWREEQTQTTFVGSWKNLSFSKWCCFDFFRCIVFISKWKSGSNTYPWNKRDTSTLNQQKTHIPTLYTLKNISHVPYKSIQKTSFWTYPQNLCQPSPSETITTQIQRWQETSATNKGPFSQWEFWLQNSLIQRSKVDFVDITCVYPNPH